MNTPNPAPVTTTAEDAQEVAAVRAPVAVATSDADLLPCPFCGASASGYGIDPHKHAMRLGDFQMPDHPGSYIIEGDCSCGSGLIGATQEEVTARWNARAPSPALPIDFKQATDQGGWQPVSTAPDGIRVLLRPREAPVVGIVRQMPEWADEQEPVASVLHYNGTVLVAGYHCSEWHSLPGAAPTLLGVADGDAVGGKSGGEA
jgi:hypothetical protein